jgi:hypothetical protein
MRAEQTVKEMAEEALGRQARALVDRTRAALRGCAGGRIRDPCRSAAQGVGGQQAS